MKYFNESYIHFKNFGFLFWIAKKPVLPLLDVPDSPDLGRPKSIPTNQNIA